MLNRRKAVPSRKPRSGLVTCIGSLLGFVRYCAAGDDCREVSCAHRYANLVAWRCLRNVRYNVAGALVLDDRVASPQRVDWAQRFEPEGGAVEMFASDLELVDHVRRGAVKQVVDVHSERVELWARALHA